jgi:UDP-glucose 4-epimerase
MSTILITGGAGFVGAHAARKLLDAGHEVWVLDYFHRYIHPIQPTFLENTHYRLDVLLKGAEIVYGTTTHKDDLRRHLGAIRPEYILHLAALPLANRALKQTEEALETIVLGTVNLLEVLRDMPPVRNFVYVSSSMVYGDFTQVPMPEDGAKNPKEIYGGMKLAGETLVKVFSQRYGIPSSIVRPSAIYGPTDNNQRVLQVFVENAVRGQRIVAVNPDRTSLDFTYVDDVADGMTAVLLSERAIGEEFNVTRGEGHTLSEAIRILSGIFPNLEVETRIEGDGYRPNRGALDVSKARRLVGYDPQHSLEEGLHRYVEFVRQHNPSLIHERARRP